MTIFTAVAAGDMVAGLSAGVETSIMTAAAIAAVIRMVPQAQVAEVGWAVTIFAHIINRNVIGGFTGCLHAVMTTDSVVFDAGMVE